MKAVLTGLDRVSEEVYAKKMKGVRLGLLANQASVDAGLKAAKTVIDLVRKRQYHG